VVLSRGGQAEQRFATLAEAVGAANSGDTIEVRGDGPFVTKSIDIQDKSLVLRAAKGHRPVIQLEPKDESAKYLLGSNASLVLEGLELRRQGNSQFKPGDLAGWIVGGSGPALYVANCQLRVPQGSLIDAPTPRCEIRNCALVRKLDTMFSAISWSGPAKGEMTLENCTHGGGHYVQRCGQIIRKRPSALPHAASHHQRRRHGRRRHHALARRNLAGPSRRQVVVNSKP
jgi:hypothetical protein